MFVFVCKDNVKKPLERPYIGTFKMLERISDKVYIIEINGRPVSVSVERFKPAHLLPGDTDDIPVVNVPCTVDQTDKPSTSTSSFQGLLKTYPGPKKKVQINLRKQFM